MPTRLQLHEILCDILETRNAYFQPPASVEMDYPAIVYGLDGIDKTFADDVAYLVKRKYSITVIDFDPDSIIAEKIAAIPSSKFNRHYEKDNLNHYVFTLYF